MKIWAWRIWIWEAEGEDRLEHALRRIGKVKELRVWKEDEAWIEFRHKNESHEIPPDYTKW